MKAVVLYIMSSLPLEELCQMCEYNLDDVIYIDKVHLVFYLIVGQKKLSKFKASVWADHYLSFILHLFRLHDECS